MQSNGSGAGALSALSVCGGEEDEGEIFKLMSPSGGGSNLAAYNLSLTCLLHILSRESSLEMHGDSANLEVSDAEGVFTQIQVEEMNEVMLQSWSKSLKNLCKVSE